MKITNEPGSAPDRVVINVDVEEQSTGEFSISGGYSTADGFIAEVSVADRNLMGRGKYAQGVVHLRPTCSRVSICRSSSRILFGYRMAGGIDIFARQNLASNYVSYDSQTVGTNLRLGFRDDRRNSVPAALYVLSTARSRCPTSTMTVSFQAMRPRLVLEAQA